jgi:hypothetical protein
MWFAYDRGSQRTNAAAIFVLCSLDVGGSAIRATRTTLLPLGLPMRRIPGLVAVKPRALGALWCILIFSLCGILGFGIGLLVFGFLIDNDNDNDNA